MVKENFSLKSSDDAGTDLHCVEWKADEYMAPKGVIFLVHGMIEYIERYEGFARYLTDRGFVVIGHDHIGHGESVSGDDGSELGIMHTRTPDRTMCFDMRTVFHYGRNRYPDIPCFYLGHSMGSFLLREFLCIYPEETKELNGAVIVGTGTTPTPAIILAKLVIGATALFHGWDYKSQRVTDFLFSGDYHRFNMDGSQPKDSWLTKDIEIVKKYYNDPYDTFLFSLNGYRGLTLAMLYDNSLSNIRRIRMDLPILFVSGSDDPVGSMGRGVRKACDRFKRAGLSDVSIRLFPGDRHEVLNETDRDKVYDFIYDWIEKHV